jgi:hypothetical protein
VVRTLEKNLEAKLAVVHIAADNHIAVQRARRCVDVAASVRSFGDRNAFSRCPWLVKWRLSAVWIYSCAQLTTASVQGAR